jgi:hypothetical protein
MLRPAALHELLAYDDATGILTWKRRPISMFSDGRQSAAQNYAIWNGKFAERPALNTPDKRGYRTGHLLSKPVKAHRIIWAMVHGEWPQGDIDHIDGDAANNRIENLREVTHAINGRNMRLKKNNQSGACGVTQRPSGRWVAKLQVDGRQITVGTFDTMSEAVVARRDAEKAHGFHTNHGEAR